MSSMESGISYVRRLISLLSTVISGVILVAPSPAFAYHDTLGGGAATGGSASIGAFLPIVVGVVVVMVGVGMWGRKKRKTKPKRRKRRK